MFSKINFTYKKTNKNRKKEIILKQLQTTELIKSNDTISLKNSLYLTNNADNNKIQSVNEIFSQTKETNIDGHTDNKGTVTLKYNNVRHAIPIIDTRQFSEEMPLFDTDYIVPFNVELIRTKGIKIINNVYQSKYNYGRANCTGLGDFIRGCYFILEFCEQYKFEAKIVFNNHISKFLRIKTHNLHLIENVLSSIQFFKNNNFSQYNIINGFVVDPKRDNTNIMADFVNYVVDSPSYYGNVFTFCNSFPRNDIPEKNKETMRDILEPINEIKLTIQQRLEELHLRIKGYTVIHIRSGDSFLKNETNNAFHQKYVHKLIHNIQEDVKYITKHNANIINKYLLIADNNNIKTVLKDYFPSFQTMMQPITHFGEGVILEEERVKNTLIDFYLLSFANCIISYSAYEHGSGFSYWCAKTFDVPYICKYIA